MMVLQFIFDARQIFVNKNKILNLIFKSIILFFFHSTFPADASEMHSMDDINKSVEMIPVDSDAVNNKLYILKAWSETHDANSHFAIQFFSDVKTPSAVSNFWQEIKLYENGRQIDLSEWVSADCSLSHNIIVNKSDQIYLYSIKREASGSRVIVPQNTPEYQRVSIFQLKKNYKDTLGMGNIWFDKTNDFISKERLCTQKEIDRFILKIIGD